MVLWFQLVKVIIAETYEPRSQALLSPGGREMKEPGKVACIHGYKQGRRALLGGVLTIFIVFVS